MCDIGHSDIKKKLGVKSIPVHEAVGMVLAHDITEIRKDDFKGRAFKKGHIVAEEDIAHLQRLGKDHLYVLNMGNGEMHEDEAAYALASALMGEGVIAEGEPKEGKINIIAQKRGLLKINHEALLEFNMLGEVMCATLHNNSVVKRGQLVGGTRAIPLIVKRNVVDDAVAIARRAGSIISVKEIRKPKAGVVITGNEVYYGRIQDAFGPVIKDKIKEYEGELVGMYYAPDDERVIQERLEELVDAGADLLITTGGMSVDPDDVTRFAIRALGATQISYGSAVLPGAMVLVAYLSSERSGDAEMGNGRKSPAPSIPIIGIPACGMYHKTTIADLVLPRILAGETIGRRELAEYGHGGLCLNCSVCKYPVCPFGK